jgi:hypothetical protein
MTDQRPASSGMLATGINDPAPAETSPERNPSMIWGTSPEAPNVAEEPVPRFRIVSRPARTAVIFRNSALASPVLCSTLQSMWTSPPFMSVNRAASAKTVTSGPPAKGSGCGNIDVRSTRDPATIRQSTIVPDGMGTSIDVLAATTQVPGTSAGCRACRRSSFRGRRSVRP